MKSTATHCRHCGVPLSPLLRYRGAQTCRAAACLARNDIEHMQALKTRLGAQARAAAVTQVPAGVPAPRHVVVLQPWRPRLVALSAAERQAHRQHLEATVAEGRLLDDSQLADFTPFDSLPQGEHLCGQCRGHCCQHGRHWHAFIDMQVLQNWLDAHPGSAPADAVAAYMQMLPERHVQGACLYQTQRGCAMPRERRAAICNGFACRPLKDVQQIARDDADAAVVAISFVGPRPQRVAVVSALGIHPLRLPPDDTGADPAGGPQPG